MLIDSNSETPGPTNPLKSLPYTQKVFEANGSTYYVEDNLSIARYKFFQQFEIELGYGMTFSDLSGKIQNAYNLANESKLADVAVLLHSMLEGLVFIGEKRPVALYVATLFINKSDEDRTKWNQTLAKEKIKDWEESGIDVNFFLITALNRVGSFAETLKEVSQLIERVGPVKNQKQNETFFDLESE